MKASLRRALPATALVFTGGCVVGPNYTAPKPAVPSAYIEPAQPASAATTSRAVPGVEAVTRWWMVFNDPELNGLIERATKSNLTLQQAVARVREARAQRAMATTSLFPSINASGSYDRGRGSRNVVLPLGGGGASSGGNSSAANSSSTRSDTRPLRSAQAMTVDDSGGSSGGAGAGSAAIPSPSAGSGSGGGGPPASPFGQGGLPGATTNLYQLGFDTSWEIDLFGGVRRALEAADAGVAAAEEAQRAALVSLLGEVADTYMELRATQRRLQIARENLQAQRSALDIANAKFKAGFTTDLDVAQQQSLVATTEAVIPTLEAAEREAEHTLAFLVAASPGALDGELAPVQALPNLPPEVPLGVPSDLLRRRPDIRRAERQLAMANAEVGVATADLFPKFSLTGALGLDSSDVKHLFDRSSYYYSIAPGIRWPILDWGRARAAVKLQNEYQQEALLVYQNAVISALKDVETALVHYSKEQERRKSLANAVDASRRARELAQQRFDHGTIDMVTVLEVQRSLLQAEDALAQSDATLRRNLIALYKALGGGWEQG